MDRVILYEKQKDVWMAIEDGSDCTITTENQLTEFIDGVDYRDDFEIREIYSIQLVELTGDTQPELYIGLSLRGPARLGAKQHFLYRVDANGWEEFYHRRMCLRSNFEFRQGDDPTRMDIYTDEDIMCDEFADSTRPYSIRRWFGSDFIWIEAGDVRVDVTNENLPLNLLILGFCGGPPLLAALLVLLMLTIRRKPHRETPVLEKPVV